MSAAPTTPAAEDGGSSPTKKEAPKPTFNEREQTLLGIAMAHCLKSGPPEIDFQKFMKHGGFNTLKTAQNTWGKIKGKLNATPANGDGEDGNTPGTPKTPKSGKATPKSTGKRGRKTDNVTDAEAKASDEDEVEVEAADDSPKKKRKPTPKKKNVKQEDSE